MAKITIEINDEPTATEIKLQVRCSTPWVTLQERARTRTLAPGAESAAYRCVKALTEDLAKRRIDLHVPKPRIIVPGGWKYSKGSN